MQTKNKAKGTNIKPTQKKQKGLGPSEVALSSIFLFFDFLLVLLSSLLTSCLFRGCMFLSLLIFICHFLLFFFIVFLLFSSMMSTSYVFTYRARWHCTYFSFFCIIFFLPLLILPPLSPLFSPISPFSPFVYVLFQHDNPPPQKKKQTQKTDFVFTEMNRAGLSEFHKNGL